jgi:protoporphyrinogen oxidase
MTDVMVLGAGPAGVGAAWRVALSGLSVTLVERAPTPGGAAGSTVVGGMRVDFGSHRLHPSIGPAILAELRALLGEDLQVRPRNGRIRLDGRWIAFPLRGSDLVRRLPPSFAWGAARDAATAWARRPKEDSFAEVLRAGLGRTMCERFYFPYARKLWGVEPNELSGEQARRRVSAASPARVIARLRAGEAKRTFLYPRRGFGQLWEAMGEAAAAAGAEVRFGCRVERVHLEKDRVRAETSDGETLEAARCWSTIPVTALARIAGAPGSVAVAANSLDFRAMLLVYLVLDVDRYSDFDAHYLPDESTPVTRVSEPKNYRDGDDPRGRTVLCAEIPCRLGDDLWEADDAALGDEVVRTLVAAGLPDPEPSDVEVRRLSHAYPIYRRGYEESFDRLDAWAASHDRLLTFGRGGLFAHDNSHHALAMAWAASAALRAGDGFDDAAWARARNSFRSHVVED